ncbi:acyltransferase family protein [Neobacillus cucumis]|uniref:acyltransferase family protein n=1 Tax=Neobacillus cucumis TaxID=1740721 RepID=UPI001964A2FC|nr:acyltransferase family protein [Neobacillus cucumis]MBM7655465.1 fucose 4-O-acetylase-like acetyltransferase [Neobacillus cucumis]
MSKRLDWLDIGKGLGMLLVMLGHAAIPTPLKTYIYTFHMPLFFFLSGYLYNKDKFPNLKVFLKRRTKSLILPYIAFSLVAYLWFLLLNHLGLVNYDNNLLTPLLGSVIAERKTIWTVHTGALWFVACLFCTELLFYFISKIGRSKKIIGFFLLFISAIGCFYNKAVGQPLPWNLDIAMISVGFYGAGYFYKEFHKKLEWMNQFKIFILLMLINFVTGYLNFNYTGERVDFYNSSLGNIFLFYLSAFSGIGAFVILIKRIKKNKSLQYIGKNSFIYLAFHQKIVFFVFSLMIQKSVFNVETIADYPIVEGLLYTLITVIILVPAVYAINHYFPFMLGKTTRKSTSLNAY